MSLKVIAEEALARLRSGEKSHETKKETEMKPVKQEPASCFAEESVCFMPTKHDLRRETPENGACFTVSFPRGGTGETNLPEHLVAGLQRLASMPVARGINSTAWPAVVVDAIRLAGEGWAAQALALGWSAVDLYGAVTDPEGAPADNGLAVRLAGRNILALCDTFAAVDEGNGGRSYFYRGGRERSTLLWELAG